MLDGSRDYQYHKFLHFSSQIRSFSERKFLKNLDSVVQYITQEEELLMGDDLNNQVVMGTT